MTIGNWSSILYEQKSEKLLSLILLQKHGEKASYQLPKVLGE